MTNDYRYAAQLQPEEQRLWATLIQISPFVTHLWGPLIGYIVLRDRGEFVRANAAQALNFQLSFLIYFVAAWLSVFIVIGFLLLPVVGVLAIVFPILAALAANRGEVYAYPLTIPFVR